MDEPDDVTPTQLTSEMINQVYDDAMKDPSLLSSLNIDELLDTLENDKNDYLENKTLSGIGDEIYEVTNEFASSAEVHRQICLKLVGYRNVDELHELHKGKHVRWIRRGTTKLTNGGIVVDIKFLDTGTHILCMNSMHKFIQYKYDDCVTFQKLSQVEQLILMSYEYADRMKDP
jgi:hypothetical protein